MSDADAVIILCNKETPYPDEEDAANITRFEKILGHIINCK